MHRLDPWRGEQFGDAGRNGAPVGDAAGSVDDTLVRIITAKDVVRAAEKVGQSVRCNFAGATSVRMEEHRPGFGIGVQLTERAPGRDQVGFAPADHSHAAPARYAGSVGYPALGQVAVAIRAAVTQCCRGCFIHRFECEAHGFLARLVKILRGLAADWRRPPPDFSPALRSPPSSARGFPRLPAAL
jgi:hypothetical protein